MLPSAHSLGAPPNGPEGVRNPQRTTRNLQRIMETEPDDIKVLVIDDEAAIVDLVKKALRRAGYAVLGATDGESGFALFRKERPVLVLTDIHLPDISGFDILKRIKKSAPLTQVIVFSGLGTTGDVIEALRRGACNYLYKPLSMEFLVHTVNGCIERYELIRERIDRKALLERQVAEQTAALAHTFTATVTSLGRLIEMRDPYTSGHQQRVSLLAFAIGQRLAMASPERDILHVAGLLHDIGKASVPSELLVKPSPLSEIEFQLIRNHPQAGYEVLVDIPFVRSLGKDVATIVRQHHERLDGSGYPDGLMGDAIEREAKVLAVADTFEAMSSHRPYRPALPVERAKGELTAHSGRLYAPDCVEACISLVEENGNDPVRMFDALSENITVPITRSAKGP